MTDAILAVGIAIVFVLYVAAGAVLNHRKWGGRP